MQDFFIGVASGIFTVIVIYVTTKHLWPAFRNTALYNGVRIDGTWEILEQRNGKQQRAGKITFKQTGNSISGQSARSRTREGKQSNRKFSYNSTIHGNQVTLLFEDKKGIGFDAGTYVFVVQNDAKTMIGMTTFHGKAENQIVSEGRTLQRVVG